jgi:hypothetical protein
VVVVSGKRWPPTFQYLRTGDSVDVATVYGTVQVTPVVCERCNGVEYITAPSGIDTFVQTAKSITRQHRRCRFQPLDGVQAPADEWERRWEQAFKWIAREMTRQRGGGEGR